MNILQLNINMIRLGEGRKAYYKNVPFARVTLLKAAFFDMYVLIIESGDSFPNTIPRIQQLVQSSYENEEILRYMPEDVKHLEAVLEYANKPTEFRNSPAKENIIRLLGGTENNTVHEFIDRFNDNILIRSVVDSFGRPAVQQIMVDSELKEALTFLRSRNHSIEHRKMIISMAYSAVDIVYLRAPGDKHEKLLKEISKFK